jgi:hypothetical protein
MPGAEAGKLRQLPGQNCLTLQGIVYGHEVAFPFTSQYSQWFKSEERKALLFAIAVVR